MMGLIMMCVQTIARQTESSLQRLNPTRRFLYQQTY